MKIIILPSGVVLQQFSHLSLTFGGIAIKTNISLNFRIVRKGLHFLSSFFFFFHSHQEEQKRL